MMYQYLVMEIQTNGTQVSNIVTAHNDLAEAWSKFYTVCSVACLTSLDRHSVVLLDNYGSCLSQQSFGKRVTEEDVENPVEG